MFMPSALDSPPQAWMILSLRSLQTSSEKKEKPNERVFAPWMTGPSTAPLPHFYRNSSVASREKLLLRVCLPSRKRKFFPSHSSTDIDRSSPRVVIPFLLPPPPLPPNPHPPSPGPLSSSFRTSSHVLSTSKSLYHVEALSATRRARRRKRVSSLSSTKHSRTPSLHCQLD